jgi:deoxycytidine triphosphate deaminase
MRCVLTASCKQRIANVLLTDRDILEEIHAGRIIIDPFDPLCVQPASYDVRLDSDLLVPDAELDGRGIDPANTDSSMMFKRVQLEDRAHPNQFYIPPGGVALGCTRELVTVVTKCTTSSRHSRVLVYWSLVSSSSCYGRFC